MSAFREKMQGRTKQMVGQMVGDDELVQEGEEQVRKAEEATERSSDRSESAPAAGATLAPAPLASAKGSAPMLAQELKDPTSKYPKPPYKKQSQLASKMEPRPDHGEKSYKGSGRLAGRKALLPVAIPGWAAPPRSPMRARAPTLPSIISRPKSLTRRKSSR